MHPFEIDGDHAWGPDPVVARLGGDEFVVVIDSANDSKHAMEYAESLLDSLKHQYDLFGHTVNSAASIGVVGGDLGYDSAEDVLRDADTAMYEAKSRGKGCVVPFDPAMQRAVQERHNLENDLREAIGTDQFHLAYQPIVRLSDGLMLGVEALARWTHPERGGIRPDVFIAIAEETRLILPLSDLDPPHRLPGVLRDADEARGGDA